MHLLFQFSWRKRVDFGCNGAFQSQLFTSPNTQPICSLCANNQYELLDLAEISMKDKFSFQNAPCCSIIYAVISQSSNIRRVFCFACCHSNHLLLCQRLGQMFASYSAFHLRFCGVLLPDTMSLLSDDPSAKTNFYCRKWTQPLLKILIVTNGTLEW